MAHVYFIFAEKGVDKEYYTVGARLIRLEDKVSKKCLS